ncbi:MAG TPA: methyltransferase domain-containing protein [Gaiellaceae bacterium]|nr:methyltransferase domain-containing protein [Gaiellaceae bacterium]
MHGDLDAWLDALSGSDEEFAARAFRLAVRRPPEPEVLADTAARLGRGELSRAGLLRDLVGSDEFAAVGLLDDAVARAAAERAAPRTVRGPARPRSLAAPAWSDERAIEIPWCLARHDGESRVLDVGYAFAEPAYLAGLLALGAGELTGVDLAERELPGLRSVVADVRDLPFGDGSFQLATCVSTLEHVGRDNAVYDVDAPREELGDEAALRELRRVLEPDGRLLVSVPTGVADDQGWQVQREPLAWVELFERAGFLVFEDELYVRGEEGWRSATLAEAEAARYGEGGPGAGAVLLAELRPRRLAERMRLVARDARHRDAPRRSTVA